MIERRRIPAWLCTCDLCKHTWNSLSVEAPAVCPACTSRAWNGVKRIGRPISPRDLSKIGLPKPYRPRNL